ncbi:transmembrane protein [Anaeramoeba flamelloides]|uniref:Transmembrane protein n=1 Tax=Anaeramoeba flamelloides TaxID=1746091 RepID=A0AAV7YJC2_9EUKA|nr:transmembrane protein [Anaeramoeba flamelloides]
MNPQKSSTNGVCETESTKKFITKMVLFVCLLLMILIFSVFGPKVWLEESLLFVHSGNKLTSSFNNLQTFHEELSAGLQLYNSENNFKQMDITIQVNLTGIDKFGSWDLGSTNHKRTLTCKSNSNCTRIMIVNNELIYYPNYTVSASWEFERSDDYLHKAYIIYIFKNTRGTVILSLLKYCFVIFACGLIFIGTYLLQNVDVTDLNFEQKSMAYLLFFLIFFNDPFNPLRYMIHSPFPEIVSALFTAIFSFLVGFILLCSFGVFYVPEQERKIKKFYLPRLLVTLPVPLILILTYLFIKIETIEDIQFSSLYDFEGIEYIGIALIVFFLIYLIYLIIVIVKANKHLKDNGKNFKKFRFILTTFIILFLFTIILVIISEFGILENNFITQIGGYIIINFYIMILFLGYLPENSLKKKLQNSNFFKEDNEEDKKMLELNSNDSDHSNSSEDEKILNNTRLTGQSSDSSDNDMESDKSKESENEN